MNARWAFALTVILCMAFVDGALARDAGPDVLIQFRGIGPVEDDDWDGAAGLEAQVRFWGADHVGVSLAFGATSWRAASEYVEEWDDYSYYSSIIEGDASLLSVGSSLWVRSPLSRHVNLTIEAGFRYVSVDSSIDTSVYYEEGADIYTGVDVIEIDDTWLATVGIHLEGQVADRIWIHGGLGYDFDLTKPEEAVFDESIGDTDFSGITFNLGVAVGF